MALIIPHSDSVRILVSTEQQEAKPIMLLAISLHPLNRAIQFY